MVQNHDTNLAISTTYQIIVVLTCKRFTTSYMVYLPITYIWSDDVSIAIEPPSGISLFKSSFAPLFWAALKWFEIAVVYLESILDWKEHPKKRGISWSLAEYIVCTATLSQNFYEQSNLTKNMYFKN